MTGIMHGLDVVLPEHTQGTDPVILNKQVIDTVDRTGQLPNNK